MFAPECESSSDRLGVIVPNVNERKRCGSLISATANKTELKQFAGFLLVGTTDLANRASFEYLGTTTQIEPDALDLVERERCLDLV